MKLNTKTGAGDVTPRLTPRASPRSYVAPPVDGSELERLRRENDEQKQQLFSFQAQVTALKAKMSGGGGGKGGTGGFVDLSDQSSALEKAKNINMLRTRLAEATKEISDVQASLDQLLIAAPATSRSGHLRSLQELIGAPPHRTWHDEWIKLKAESYRLAGQGEATIEEDMAYVAKNDTIEQFKNQEGVREDIGILADFGWPRERAEIYTLLFTCANALGRALRDHDPCYAASIYALSDTLFAQRNGGRDEKEAGSGRVSSKWGKKAAVSKPIKPPPSLYYHRDGGVGSNSLCFLDPAWEELEEADATGFRGLCSSALVHAHCDPRLFSEGGIMGMKTELESGQTVLETMESDVICFESYNDDEHGAHSAIVTSATAGDFPPNTLFRLKEVYAPGKWEAPVEAGQPPLYPMQRLITVTATYQPPRAGLAANEGGAGGKYMEANTMLTYNKRDAFTKGLDDLIAKPSMTMADEFARNDSWVDWKGVKYTALQEWQYVNGKAATKQDCTPGTRDEKNNGLSREDFLKRANDFIRTRRGQNLGTMLTEDHAFLTMDEVLAVRLYSGPAYQPINTFLRQISSLTAAFRVTVGQHPGLTYAATVGHICRAIRKLAAVATVAESETPLYRGVRGSLASAFWMPDGNDMVCAVDMAFMSTSRKDMTPINYMQREGSNVLWRLHPKAESDSGFHSGATIEMLSQFAGEEEVMFPPCTMLIVKEEPKLAAAKRAGDLERVKRLTEERGEVHPLYGIYEAKEVTSTAAAEVGGGERTFLQIDVLPIFL